MSFLLKNITPRVKEGSALSSHVFDNYRENIKAIDADHLIDLFNSLFCASYNTRLISGGEEPEYRPADAQHPYNRIIFTRDYTSSALHEIAHWCVAGEARRQQLDYGYWYIPDGRNTQQQMLFEEVEVKPQALEWIFSEACGIKFSISVDNLDANETSNNSVMNGVSNSGLEPSLLFKQCLVEQVHQYCLVGLNERAEKWVSALITLRQMSVKHSRSKMGEIPLELKAAAFTLSALG